jgi:hypothetical protein
LPTFDWRCGVPSTLPPPQALPAATADVTPGSEMRTPLPPAIPGTSMSPFEAEPAPPPPVLL